MNKTPKPPRGYEVAPMSHIYRHGIDIVKPRYRDAFCTPMNGKPPPKGFEFVDALGGYQVRGFARLFFGYRPIARPIPRHASSITLKRGRCGCWPTK